MPLFPDSFGKHARKFFVTDVNVIGPFEVKEDLFESIIGAIYIDSGMSIDSVIGSVELMLDVSDYLKAKAASLGSAKNRLQEWCASKKVKKSPPVYEKVSESGPDHKKSYKCACYIDGELYGVGEGRSVKAAETAAAEEALSKISRK